jgi:pyruvate kinase
MTDVANAVLDGVHCVMLSGETAIGSFPVESVETIAAIVRNAESATSYDTQHNFIRDVTSKPFSTEEGVAAAVAQSPLDGSAKLVIVITETGRIADLVAKFKSSVPIYVVTTDAKVAACSKITFGQYPCLLKQLGTRADINELVKSIVERARGEGLYTSGSVTLVHGANEPDSEIEPTFNQISEQELKNL